MTPINPPSRVPGNLAIIASFLLALAERPDMLMRLWRAFAKMQKAETMEDFRRGIIQFAKALEVCYPNE